MEQKVQTQEVQSSTQLVTALGKVGIALKPKLADVVELVMAEKIKEFHHNLIQLRKEGDSISIAIKELNEKNLVSGAKKDPLLSKIFKIIDSEGLSFEISIRTGYFQSKSYINLKNVDKNNNNNNFIDIGFKSPCALILPGNHNVSFHFSSFRSDYVYVDVTSSKELEKLLKQILEHNQKVSDFVSEWNGLSFSRMKSAIKSQFQKKAIETLPTEVSKLLESTFNINL